MRAHAHPHLHLGHNSVTPYPIERRTVEASPSTANSVRRTLVVLTGRVSGDVRFTRCAHRVPKKWSGRILFGSLIPKLMQDYGESHRIYDSFFARCARLHKRQPPTQNCCLL